MQDIGYTFDNASNVTGIVNNAGVVNTLGGAYRNTYRYDALHRLVESYGGGDIGNYNTNLSYSPSGRLRGKFRGNNSVTLSASVEMAYGYCDDYQPHAVKRMFDYKNGMLYDLRWDEAGNLGQVSMARPDEMFEGGRFLYWTEDSRMHAAVDDRYYSYYAYDHSGERRLKLTGQNDLLDVNADFMSSYTILTEPTLYPSAYMVLTNKGYTNVTEVERRTSSLVLPRCSNVTEGKHYYAGMERVAARLGGGGLNALCRAVGSDEGLQTKADLLFGQSFDQVNSRVLQENNLHCIMGNEFATEVFGHPIDGIPNQMKAGTDLNHDLFKDMVYSMLDDSQNGQESEVYFYHSDHLGSVSWITDVSGVAVQHIQYLPYGEPYINQHPFVYSERFTFTGKERDGETGYGYFGARYMDHELMTMWLSVDPMADKYPGISPYNYCMWNPIKLVDPDGNDTVKIHLDKGRFKYIRSEGDHCIHFYREKKFIEDETMTISREVCRITELTPQHLQYEQDGDIRVGCTQYIEFSHIASGEAVFRKIAELGAGRDLVSMEWDYYELDNRGELSSSGLVDKMLHLADRYRYFKKMHHFHPFNEDESYYPSVGIDPQNVFYILKENPWSLVTWCQRMKANILI